LLPWLAEAPDLLIDPAFVAIVPLGGRYVQHFWRLLSGFKIPYATLLDLDLGRQGGGFGRGRRRSRI
jgi:putative ATP-dependent endonuclease of OLD family